MHPDDMVTMREGCELPPADTDAPALQQTVDTLQDEVAALRDAVRMLNRVVLREGA